MTVDSDVAPHEEPDPLDQALLTVDHLALTVRHGVVFAPVSFRLRAGELGLVVGRSGTGRSSLLLALTGRMKGVTGSVRLHGVDALAQSRRARSMTSVARIGDLIDLQPQLTVAESVTERTLLDAIPSRVGWQRYAGVAEQLELDLDDNQLVGDLTALDATVLAVAVALLRPADLIVLDDVDHGLSVAEQQTVLDRLSVLCRHGHTLVASTTESSPAPPDTVIVNLSDQPPTPAQES